MTLSGTTTPTRGTPRAAAAARVLSWICRKQPMRQSSSPFEHEFPIEPCGGFVVRAIQHPRSGDEARIFLTWQVRDGPRLGVWLPGEDAWLRAPAAMIAYTVSLSAHQGRLAMRPTTLQDCYAAVPQSE